MLLINYHITYTFTHACKNVKINFLVCKNCDKLHPSCVKIDLFIIHIINVERKQMCRYVRNEKETILSITTAINYMATTIHEIFRISIAYSYI